MVVLLPAQLEKWANPTPDEFEAAVDRAIGVIIEQKRSGIMAGGKISGTLLELSEVNNLVVVSDVHGDYECFSQILNEINYASYLSDPRNKLVFLGDYVDRGSNSVAVLYSVCQLKAEHPDSVIPMRGNHEAPSEFPFTSHDFPSQLADRFGEAAAKPIYRKTLLFFKELIIAAIVADRLLLVHGGLPTQELISNYRTLLSTAQENHMKNSVLEEVLWNDPRPVDSVAGWENSRRGIGRHFGEEITKRWLEVSGTKCIVRGHEPCPGFRIDHDGRILTLFSSRTPYPSFKAAYLSMAGTDLQSIRDARDLVPFVKYPQ
jgi:diadenosine tetraphosphatase ApaH/serine/threonine PP2A family protein phosphatase